MSINAIEDWEIRLASAYASCAYDKTIPGAFRYDSKLGTTAFFLIHNDSQWIIYRGTEEPKDWIMNASAFPWRVCKRWVHAGFAISQKSVWKKIRKQLKPARKTYCVGHSLGGAAATVAALRLSQDTKDGAFDDIRLITFGRPNVFVKGKKSMDNLTCNISVVSGSDIVATVPRVFYGPDGGKSQDIIYLSNVGEKDYLNPDKEFRQQDRRAHLSELVSDHMMETSYAPRVEKLDLEALCESA